MIQVAGIHDLDEALLCLNAGATHIGFTLRLPVNAEDCSEAEAKAIIAALPDPACAVLITYLDDAREIVDFCAYLGVSMVQLHGEVRRDTLLQVRALAPHLRIIKSLVTGKFGEAALLALIADLHDVVDFFITDSYNPETGASGATGRTHDWQLGRRLVAASPKPVIIAGGLTPTNVVDAIHAMQPFGVDVHSGVEASDGRKQANLVTRFCELARTALADSQSG